MSQSTGCQCYVRQNVTSKTGGISSKRMCKWFRWNQRKDVAEQAPVNPGTVTSVSGAVRDGMEQGEMEAQMMASFKTLSQHKKPCDVVNSKDTEEK